MNLLIILKDIEEISIESSLRANKSINEIWLLCLSPRGKSSHYKELIQSAIKKNIDIKSINPKEFVDFDDLQKFFLQYIANLPQQIKVGGVNLSDYMVVHGVNLWWASRTVEATAYKSIAFPNFYYLSAIQAVLGSLNITEVWFQVKGLSFEKDLKSLLNQSAIKCHNLDKKVAQNFFLSKVLKTRLPGSIISCFLHLFASIIFKVIWPNWARPTNGETENKSIHLFYCLYPGSIRIGQNKVEAKIYGTIPSALESKLGGKAYYISNFTAGGLLRIKSLITNLLKFWKHRFPVFPMQIFLSARDILKVYLSSEGKRKYRALKEKKEYFSAFNLKGIDLYHTFDQEIKESFLGQEMQQNLLLFFAFQRLSEKFGRHIFQIIYFVEFHAWEVVILNGVRSSGTFVPIIGLQQSAPNPILLSFFFPLFIFQKNDYAYPLPDLIATSGEYYKKQLLSFGVHPDKIQIAGLIEDKYMYQQKLDLATKKTLRQEMALPFDGKICLVACSIDPIITDGILYLLSRVIPRYPGVYFLIKEHPNNPISSLVKRYGFKNFQNAKTTIQPMSVIMPLSDYFLSSSSSTSLEALALGITQANLDVGGLPKTNPLHMFPDLIRDLEKEEDFMEFFQYPERFEIDRECAKTFFGNAIFDPVKIFTDTVNSKFRENQDLRKC